jgi:hypothetical protein
MHRLSIVLVAAIVGCGHVGYDPADYLAAGGSIPAGASGFGGSAGLGGNRPSADGSGTVDASSGGGMTTGGGMSAGGGMSDASQSEGALGGAGADIDGQIEDGRLDRSTDATEASDPTPDAQPDQANPPTVCPSSRCICDGVCTCGVTDCAVACTGDCTVYCASRCSMTCLPNQICSLKCGILPPFTCPGTGCTVTCR